MPKKRKRGRPPKSETLARRQAEREEAEERKAAKVKAAEPRQAEEEEDDVVDSGAIDDPEGQTGRFLLNPKSDHIEMDIHFFKSVKQLQYKSNIHCPCSSVYMQRIVTTAQQRRTAKKDHLPYWKSPLPLFPPPLMVVLDVRLVVRGSTAP